MSDEQPYIGFTISKFSPGSIIINGYIFINTTSSWLEEDIEQIIVTGSAVFLQYGLDVDGGNISVYGTEMILSLKTSSIYFMNTDIMLKRTVIARSMKFDTMHENKSIYDRKITERSRKTVGL